MARRGRTLLLWRALIFTSSLVVAQDLASISVCGQMCISNSLTAASAFGCAENDISCLCADPRFGFALRDCTNEACGPDALAAVAAYGQAVCSAAGVTAGGAAPSSAVETSSAIGTLSVVRPSTTFVTTVFGILGGASEVATGNVNNATAVSTSSSATGPVSSTIADTAATGVEEESSGGGLSVGAKAGIGAGVGAGGLLVIVLAFLCYTGRIAITLGKGRRSGDGTDGDGAGTFSKPELEAIEKKEAKEATVDPVELPGEAALHEAPNAPFGETLHEVSSREIPAELPNATASAQQRPPER